MEICNQELITCGPAASPMVRLSESTEELPIEALYSQFWEGRADVRVNAGEERCKIGAASITVPMASLGGE